MSIRRLLDYWTVILVFALFGYLSISMTRNLTNKVLQSRVTNAAADVRDLEINVTRMLADAGTSPGAFFRSGHFSLHTFGLTHGGSTRPVDAAVEIYSRVFRVLLEYGRSAPLVCASSGSVFAQSFDTAVVSRLAKTYSNNLTDPWGQPYRFYPIPWSAEPNPNGSSGVRICIWSSGADRISQAYAAGQTDDITNLDGKETWRAEYQSMAFWKKFSAAFF